MEHPSPSPTVDIIIELASGGIVLVQRKFPPLGWAIPGGFVEVGERLATAAVREAKEETSLEVTLTDLLGCYSDPARDPRGHTVSTPLAFDHATILADYFQFRASGTRPPLDR